MTNIGKTEKLISGIETFNQICAYFKFHSVYQYNLKVTFVLFCRIWGGSFGFC